MKKNTQKGVIQFGNSQLTVLVLLRMLIGWHFLYEGVVKLYNPSWSAGGFLADSKWIFADFFQSLAANPQTLEVVNFLNVWGLIAIGLGLMLGIFSRAAAVGGMLLLAMYYLSHPPFIGLKYALPAEGSYLIVNKNLIELFALAVIYALPTSRIIGIDRLVYGANDDVEDEQEKNEVQHA